tara:strand:+ start:6066 stop:6428 length:363 start_codon:yes stop_codon:yes gene_type:complete
MNRFAIQASAWALSALLWLSIPLIVSAQNLGYFGNILVQLRGLFALLLPLLVGLAVVVFVWGVILYIGSGDSEDKRRDGRNLMVFGIIAIFVIVSIWGFVRILQTLTGATSNVPQVPAIP